MKALNKRFQVDYFVYTGNIPDLMVWLQTQGMDMVGEDIVKADKVICKVYDRYITFFNHFVHEDGRLFKMTQEQFNFDYQPV